MRGMKTVGLFLILAAAFGSLVPAPTNAQGAGDAQYYAAGNQSYSAHNYSQAAQYYYAAVKLNPNNAAAYQGLGNCYYALGRKSDALVYYKRASALQPGNSQLAQFVQNLQAQLGGGATATGAAAPNYLAYGNAYLQRRQYANALQYFQRAIQQDPNDYKGYYYGGYAYVAAGDSKDGTLYYEIAAAKSGNASYKAYADRLKASLAPADQEWVDDQVAKYTGGTAMASVGGAGKGAKNGGLSVGVHVLGGGEYIFADPTQIKQYVSTAYGSTAGNGPVSLNGIAPNIVALPEVQPYIQLGQNFEINLSVGYFPVGNLSYTTFDYNLTDPDGSAPDVWKYTLNTTIITADLGVKLLFGDDKVRGYLGISGGLSPISLAFTKISYDHTGTNVSSTGEDTVSSGTYNATAFNAQALLGVDFSLGGGISVGPYVGYRYLNATNFQNGTNTLSIDTNTGAVGIPNTSNVSNNTTPLTLDFSGVEGGLNISFSL